LPGYFLKPSNNISINQGIGFLKEGYISINQGIGFLKEGNIRIPGNQSTKWIEE
jgi:hypothetical protein